MADRLAAEEALFDAIIEGTKGAVEAKSPESLKEIALAFSHVVHGPQGGAWQSHIRDDKTQQTDYRYKAESDYHETRHEGEDRERPPAGFQGQ